MERARLKDEPRGHEPHHGVDDLGRHHTGRRSLPWIAPEPILGHLVEHHAPGLQTQLGREGNAQAAEDSHLDVSPQRFGIDQ